MSIPPYAPTSNSSYPSYSARISKNVSLDEDIKLYNTVKQREIYELLAELYAIIVTLDFLERAFFKDSITQQEYTPTCLKLLAQYNSILKNEDVASEFDNIDSFKRRYNMNFAHATSRLKIGVPATVEQAVDAPPSSNPTSGPLVGASARAVAEATGNFITCMDALKLNYKAKDQLHPLLSELMTSLNKVTTLDFEGRSKIISWLITLNSMKVNEEISEEQGRQLLFDLDTAYKAFYTTLE